MVAHSRATPSGTQCSEDTQHGRPRRNCLGRQCTPSRWYNPVMFRRRGNQCWYTQIVNAPTDRRCREVIKVASISFLFECFPSPNFVTNAYCSGAARPFYGLALSAHRFDTKIQAAYISRNFIISVV
jgi:hypothetical protein